MDLLPRWDTTALHPELGGRSFVEAQERLAAEVDRLVELHDELGIGDVEPHPPSPDELDAIERVLAATNDVLAVADREEAFVYAFVATDSRDVSAQAALSVLQRHESTMRQLNTRLSRWVAALGADALAAGGPAATDHAWPLRRLSERAEHQMSQAEEQLYAELSLTGSNAWSRLHADVTSQLSARVTLPDGVQILPMTTVRGLATDPDRAVRQAAYDAELDTWPSVAVPLAGALNAIKGEAVAVNGRRGWTDPVDASLFANAIDRPTFDAMQVAVEESLSDFRRWLLAKARLHGHDGALPWWDLFAPLPMAPGTVSWDEGTRTVTEAFDAYAAPLGTMARRAFDEQWVDAGPREGKRGGAFCMPFVDDRSLVLMNWSSSFDSVQTLAHELGHAYHNVQLAGRTPMQRQLTMALAETASIFCETLVVEAGLAAATPTQRLVLLDTDLQGAAQVVVDIRSRFLFEQSVFERRAERTLSPAELVELMTAAQQEAYGDGVEASTLHPWMWAVKPHYYGTNFYNWPYTFGLLFGLGLFARYQTDPDRFRGGYDDLLSAVGLAPATELAQRFGIDLRDVAFWRASLDTIRGRIEEYERLAADAKVTGVAG